MTKNYKHSKILSPTGDILWKIEDISLALGGVSEKEEDRKK